MVAQQPKKNSKQPDKAAGLQVAKPANPLHPAAGAKPVETTSAAAMRLISGAARPAAATRRPASAPAAVSTLSRTPASPMQQLQQLPSRAAPLGGALPGRAQPGGFPADVVAAVAAASKRKVDPFILAHVGSDGSTDANTKQLVAAIAASASQGTNGALGFSIPAPDPNRPMTNAPMQLARPEATHRPAGSSLAQIADAIATSIAPVAAPRAAAALGKPNSAAGKAVKSRSSADQLPEQARKMLEKDKAAKKMESEFGRSVALSFKELDPRKALVRHASSRFQGAVDDERAAKRMRRLHELEMQDAAEERMEALKEITVQAFRCEKCQSTSESIQAKITCEQNGHTVVAVKAKRQRWECRGCLWSLVVLDGDVPSHCHKCNDSAWRQVPLHKARRSWMPKEEFLARGEELPFLNSLPNQQVNRFKEAEDDYAPLYQEHA